MHDDTTSRLIAEFYLNISQLFSRYRLHNGQQIAFQQRQNYLCFGIAEAAVVLDDLGAVRGEHQPKYRQPLKGQPSAFMA